MSITTNVLSPVTTPGLIYPVLGIPRKRKKCKHCYGSNIRVTRTKYYEKYIAEDLVCEACGWQGSDIEEIPQRVELSEKLIKQISGLYKKTENKDIEYGALILRKDEKIYLGFEQQGKAHEIVLKEPDKLDKGEELLGTVHTHPLTDTPSPWDIATFLVNGFEKSSIIVGSSGNINLIIKNKDTKKLETDNLRKWANSNSNISSYELAEKYKFLYYEGPYNGLVLKVGKSDIIEENLDEVLKNIG